MAVKKRTTPLPTRDVLTLDSNGKDILVPKNIITSANAAYDMYESDRRNNMERIYVYSMIEGIANGNTPYDPAMLEAEGVDYIANFNNFKAAGYISRTAQLYHSLRNSTDVLVKFYLSLPGNPPEASRYARIMSKNFSDIIKEWPDYHTNMDMVDNQLASFGISPIHWPNEKDWQWEVVDVSKFIVPNGSSSNLEQLTRISIESEYTLQDLYQIYSKGSKDWNKDALRDYLVYRGNQIAGNTNDPIMNPLQLQRRIQSNDSFASNFFNEKVRLVNMFQKEFSGKVSHYIFDRDRYLSRDSDTDVAFLFMVSEQYDCITDCMCLFTASPGKWTIHSNLGIGHKVLAQSSAVNILDCSIMDMGRMSSTPLIRTLAAGGGRDTAPLRITPGVPNDIGAAEFVPNTLGTNINQVVASAQYLTASMDSTMMNAGDDPGTPDRAQGSISQSQARAKSFKESGFLKNTMYHHYNMLDYLWLNTFKRMMAATDGSPNYKYVEEWMTRCIEDGVPSQLFVKGEKGLNGLPRQFRRIMAARVSGDGSTAGRIAGLDALNPLINSFDPKEMSEYKKDYIEAAVGVDAAQSYASSDDQKDEVNGGASLATVENFMCKMGASPQFSPDNDQISHITVHMQEAMQLEQGIAQQQISPVDADKEYGFLIPHLEQHMQFIEGVPMLYQTHLEELKEPFAQLLQFVQLNRRNAQAMQEAALRKQQEDQAATQQVMSDAQRKDFVAQSDVKRADTKVQAQVERGKEASDTKAQILKQTTEAKIENEKEKTRAKNEATAIGRSKNEMADTPTADLEKQISNRLGKTPSGVDFEV